MSDDDPIRQIAQIGDLSVCVDERLVGDEKYFVSRGSLVVTVLDAESLPHVLKAIDDVMNNDDIFGDYA